MKHCHSLLRAQGNPCFHRRVCLGFSGTTATGWLPQTSHTPLRSAQPCLQVGAILEKSAFWLLEVNFAVTGLMDRSSLFPQAFLYLWVFITVQFRDSKVKPWFLPLERGKVVWPLKWFDPARCALFRGDFRFVGKWESVPPFQGSISRIHMFRTWEKIITRSSLSWSRFFSRNLFFFPAEICKGGLGRERKQAHKENNK